MSSFDLAQRNFYFWKKLLEDYSEEAHQSAIAFVIKFSTSHQVWEEQFDHLGSESEDDDYKEIMNPTKVKIVSHDILQVLPDCPLIHWPSQMLNDSKICFVHAPLITTKPWREKRKYQFTLIMGAILRTWLPCNYWIIWKEREILLARLY